MASATAARPRARKAAASKVTVATPDEIRAVERDIKVQEREVVLHAAMLNALAGKNLCLIGPPGTGKSMIVREICKRIGVADEEMHYFEKALHPQLPVDALMGAYDMEKLLKESRLERKIDGYMPTAHSVFLDELARVNGPGADALLPMMNPEERLFELNGSMAKAPTLFMQFATNFLPDASDPHLGAFVSRITNLAHVDYIKSDDSFVQLMRDDQARKRGEPQMEPQARVSLAGFIGAQASVRHVDVLRGDFPEEFAKLRRTANSKGLIVDDRRWIGALDMARSAAYLAARNFCVPEDLCSLEFSLWRELTDIPIVAELLLDYRSTFEQDAAKFRDEAADAIEKHEQLRPIVEGTPPQQPLDPGVSRNLGDAGRSMKATYLRAKAKLKDAERQQRDAPALRDLIAELEGWRDWRLNNELPASWK